MNLLVFSSRLATHFDSNVIDLYSQMAGASRRRNVNALPNSGDIHCFDFDAKIRVHHQEMVGRDAVPMARIRSQHLGRNDHTSLADVAIEQFTHSFVTLVSAEDGTVERSWLPRRIGNVTNSGDTLPISDGKVVVGRPGWTCFGRPFLELLDRLNYCFCHLARGIKSFGVAKEIKKKAEGMF
jgi:hypothetical protein